jgi:hypothetical protein
MARGLAVRSVSDLEQAVRERLKELHVKVAYQSLLAATGIPLIGVRDVISSSIEIAGLFTPQTQALVWIENGAGSSIGIALVGAGDDLILNVNDEFEIGLEGGITPETIIRLALSELDYAAECVVSLTLFSDPGLTLSPKLVALDARFPQRALVQSGQSWPAIFPRHYFLDDEDRPRNTCLGWAMGSAQPVLVSDYRALRGCNLFLRQCQMVTPRLHS